MLIVVKSDDGKNASFLDILSPEINIIDGDLTFTIQTKQGNQTIKYDPSLGMDNVTVYSLTGTIIYQGKLVRKLEPEDAQKAAGNLIQMP